MKKRKKIIRQIFLPSVLSITAFIFISSLFLSDFFQKTLDADILKKLITAGITASFISFLFCYYIGEKLKNYIEKIRKNALRYSEEDFKENLSISNFDNYELARLGAAINDMAGTLKEKIEKKTSLINEYMTVLSSMTEGVIALNTEEKIISINRAGKNILELSEKNIIGKSLYEVIRDSKLNKFTDYAADIDDFVKHEIALYNENEQKIFSIQASPLENSDKTRIGTLLVFNDITRIKTLEEVRKRFVENVSHEIKTPLTSIKGFSETLIFSEELKEKKETLNFLNIINKNADRLNSIVDDLLELSKIECGEKEGGITFNTDSVNKVVLSAVNICRKKSDEKNINITFSCNDNFNAEINSPLLEQAFVNMLDNAIKYSPEHTNIIIEIFKTSIGKTGVSIKDEGIGIAQNHIPHLFERFYRVDKARSRKLGGTGLGLAITKHIINAHKGEIEVKSEPCKGSIFTIRI